MLRIRIGLLFFFIMFVAATKVNAVTLFTAVLNGSQETPPNGSTANGAASFNDNNPNDVVVSPFAIGVGGTVSGKWDAPEGNSTTLAAQLSEPEAISLLGLGLLVVVYVCRRRFRHH